MESQDYDRSQASIPRLSRIPLPRTSLSINSLDIHQDTSHKASQIPRISAAGSLRLKAITPLSEARKQPHGNSHHTSSQLPKHYTPVRYTPPQDASIALETTPPSNHNTYHYVEGDENSINRGANPDRQKRRPRPSLSERTVETLSQIPPSPSPTRRSSVTSSNSSFASSSRPASALRSSQSTMNMRGRAASPSKLPFRPPGRMKSPKKESTALSSLADQEQVYTPPRALVKGSRMAVAKSLRGSRGANFMVQQSEESQDTTTRPTSYASKAKSMYNLRGAASASQTQRPSLASLFKEPPLPSSSNGKSSKSYFDPNRNTSLLKPRSPGENVLASSSPGNGSKRFQSKQIQKTRSSEEQGAGNDGIKSPLKSSLLLRETIAKAKAANKEAARKARSSVASGGDHVAILVEDDPLLEVDSPVNNRKTLQRRIESAVTTGHLNIAAMGLKLLPTEIQRMYDFDQNSKISWSEAVDLTKLLASDNELEELTEEFFPDWSIQELQDDDEKTNQFGGLQVLDLRGNQLTKMSLGLRRLEQLQTLNLSNNNLGADVLDIVCQIPNLKELNMANNKLQGSLPSSVTNMTELQVLDLHSNCLTSIPDTVCNLQKLQKLDVSDNRLTDIPITAIQDLSLFELNLSHNSLSGILFQNSFVSTKLQVLNVSFNRLEILCEHDLALPKLQLLACDGNQLTKLPNLQLLGLLTTLTASENKIESLPDGFTTLGNLRSVNLSVNDLTVLEPGIANMDNLTSMNISANPLRDRKYLAMDTADLKSDLANRFGVNETNMDGPELKQGNTITSSGSVASLANPSYSYKPENGILSMSGEGLTSLATSMIDLSQTVHTIRLSNNDLAEFPTDLLSHPMVSSTLRSLDLSHNQSLHSTDYLRSEIQLPALQSLYIVSTGLTSLTALTTYLKAPMLKELNISCHRMTGAVPSVRASFPSMTTLLATDNWFTDVSFESIQGLEVVDISNNDIDYLPPKIGELGNMENSKALAGRLRAFECSGNRFRVPRFTVLEKGTEAVLRDLRRMVPAEEVGDEWRE